MKYTIPIFIVGILLGSALFIPLVPALQESTIASVNKISVFERKTFFQQNILSLQNHRMQSTVFSLSDDFMFTPEEITLEDDAFHGADTLHFTEWWYFDAMLNDGYSIQFIFQIYSMFNQNIVNAKLNVYHDGETVIKKDKLYLPQDFTTSTRIPLVMLNGERVMSAKKIDGHFEYLIELQMDDIQAEFTFTGTTKGWKGDVTVGQWVVPLPKAQVEGTLTRGTTQLQLSGTGYHDHNYEITAETGLYYGWYWGKMSTETATITWSNIMPTWFLNEPLMVINQGPDTIININPENIKIQADEFMFANGYFIPGEFSIKATSETVNLQATIDVLDIHHVHVGPIKYWRYHVHTTGSLLMNNHEEIELIDEYQITEFIRFR